MQKVSFQVLNCRIDQLQKLGETLQQVKPTPKIIAPFTIQMVYIYKIIYVIYSIDHLGDASRSSIFKHLQRSHVLNQLCDLQGIGNAKWFDHLSTIEVSKIFNGSGMIELAEMNWWKGSLAFRYQSS